MSVEESNIKQISWPKSNPCNYEFNETLEEPLYDPKIHLDLELPEYIINLKFEKLSLNGMDINNENDLQKIKDFLKPGLAFTSPFKVLSNEGLTVIRKIMNFHLENTKHLSKHTDRQAWCMRGLGYVSRFIRDFNRCEVVAKKMSLFSGKEVVPHAMPLNYSHINVGVPGTGKKVDQWHLDSVGYVLVVIISEPSGIVGGDLQVLKRDTTAGSAKESLEILNSQTDSYTPDEIMSVSYGSAGNAVYMQGSHIFHQVTTVLESTVGPRLSLVNSFMTANVFDKDWTKFSTFRDGDPKNITYLEYARLVAWRTQGILDYVVNKIDFDKANDSSEKQKAIKIMKNALDELNEGYLLLTDNADDLIGYHDSKSKQIKGYIDADS